MVDISEQTLNKFKTNKSQSFLISDFDGTLSKIVAEPGAATIDEVAFKNFTALSEIFSFIGILTGRPFSFISRLLEENLESGKKFTGRFLLFSLYGNERSELNKDFKFNSPEVFQYSSKIKYSLSELQTRKLMDLPKGVFVEDKGLTIAVHVRNSSTNVDDLISNINVRDEFPDFEVFKGREHFEIRPKRFLDKGDIIRELGQSLSGIYIGDDTSDIPAFNAIDALSMNSKERSYLKVAIFNRETESILFDSADIVLDSQEEVAEFFEVLRRL